MYSYIDYLRNGSLFLNNLLRPRHKRLSSLMIYATTRCQSRCRHCHIWEKPHESLSLDDIIRIVGSKCVTPQTEIGLEGGEFILHPQADDILDWFSKHHRRYTLLSNGLAPRKVIAAARKYHPAHLYLSLDGDREAYEKMRGVDGHDRVVRVLEECKDTVPTSLMFCLSPWNSFKDMDYVINMAKRHGVDVRIGVYGTMDFFDTKADMPAEDIKTYMEGIPTSIHDTDENFDYVALYARWRNGELRLRCHSIFNELVVHSNGDVPLCQNLGVTLGNIHEQTLDDIFNSAKAIETQRLYSRNCNKCWINYHRKFDVILLRSLERVLPKPVIETVYGQYQWCGDEKTTYKELFKQKQ